MNWEKIIQVVAAIAVGLFIPFVLQCLWNWFAVPAFTPHEILYWQMFGIFLFARVLLFQGSDPETDYRWKKALTVLALLQYSVPEKHREIAQDKIREINDQSWQSGLQKPFTEALFGTIALGIGWVVHVFLTHGK